MTVASLFLRFVLALRLMLSRHETFLPVHSGPLTSPTLTPLDPKLFSPLALQRNLTYILLICHFFACVLYFAARVDGFSPNSWVGFASTHFEDASPLVA